MGHEWKATVANRANGAGCLECTGRKLTHETNLEATFPQLLKDWDYTKNSNINPSDVHAGSKQKVWWRCVKGHSYKAQIYSRTKLLTGCPFCSNQSSRPELRVFSELSGIGFQCLHRHKLDGYEIDVFIPDLNFAVEYDGSHFHTQKNRLRDLQKVKSLESKGLTVVRLREHPLAIEREYDFQVNRKLSKSNIDELVSLLEKRTDAIFAESCREYLGKESFLYESQFRQFVSQLPKSPTKESIETTHPLLCKEWDTKKNLSLTPGQFTKGSTQKVWWKCEHGHSWEATINSRSQGRGCPYCSGKAAGADNSLAFQYPNTLHQWDYEKNAQLTPKDVTPGSSRKVWWICKHGHNFKRYVHRHQRECPMCSPYNSWK